MGQYVFTFWAKEGHRDQSNCLNGWGRRTVAVQGQNRDDALANLIGFVGRDNYGGLLK